MHSMRALRPAHEHSVLEESSGQREGNRRRYQNWISTAPADKRLKGQVLGGFFVVGFAIALVNPSTRVLAKSTATVQKIVL
jgi:hypothetical protein